MANSTLLIENQRVLSSLEKIVGSLSRDLSCRDDLMQEGLIHLWRAERMHPGQRPSWYLQGCRFHLQHYLCSGRSLDSNKRRGNRVFEAAPRCLEELPVTNGHFDEVSARDLMRTMAASLKPRERAVLHCLADGFRTTDIARRLKLSAPTVVKYRRRIAVLAAQLGIANPNRRRPFRAGDERSRRRSTTSHSPVCRLAATCEQKERPPT